MEKEIGFDSSRPFGPASSSHPFDARSSTQAASESTNKSSSESTRVFGIASTPAASFSSPFGITTATPPAVSQSISFSSFSCRFSPSPGSLVSETSSGEFAPVAINDNCGDGKRVGSRFVSYSPFQDSSNFWGPEILISISAMPAYNSKSPEELRWDDFRDEGRRRLAAQQPVHEDFISQSPFQTPVVAAPCVLSPSASAPNIVAPASSSNIFASTFLGPTLPSALAASSTPALRQEFGKSYSSPSSISTPAPVSFGQGIGKPPSPFAAPSISTPATVSFGQEFGKPPSPFAAPSISAPAPVSFGQGFGQPPSPFAAPSISTPPAVSQSISFSSFSFRFNPSPGSSISETSSGEFAPFAVKDNCGDRKRVGSRVVPYAPFQDSSNYWGPEILISISAMPAYNSKSPEELRWDDFRDEGRRRLAAQQPVHEDIISQTPFQTPVGAAPCVLCSTSVGPASPSALAASSTPALRQEFGKSDSSAAPVSFGQGFGKPPSFAALSISTPSPVLFGQGFGKPPSPFAAPSISTPAPVLFGQGFGKPPSPFASPSISTPAPVLFGQGFGKPPSPFASPAISTPAPVLFGQGFGKPPSTFAAPSNSTSSPVSFGQGFGNPPSPFSAPSISTPAPISFGQEFGKPPSPFAAPSISTSAPISFGQEFGKPPSPFAAPSISTPAPLSTYFPFGTSKWTGLGTLSFESTPTPNGPSLVCTFTPTTTEFAVPTVASFQTHHSASPTQKAGPPFSTRSAPPSSSLSPPSSILRSGFPAPQVPCSSVSPDFSFLAPQATPSSVTPGSSFPSFQASTSPTSSFAPTFQAPLLPDFTVPTSQATSSSVTPGPSFPSFQASNFRTSSFVPNSQATPLPTPSFTVPTSQASPETQVPNAVPFPQVFGALPVLQYGISSTPTPDKPTSCRANSPSSLKHIPQRSRFRKYSRKGGKLTHRGNSLHSL